MGDEQVNTNTPDDLIGVPAVLALLDCSLSTLTRLRERPSFPRAIVIARCHDGRPRAVCWPRKAIADWKSGQGR